MRYLQRPDSPSVPQRAAQPRWPPVGRRRRVAGRAGGGSTGGSVSTIVARSLRDRCAIVARSLRRRTSRAFNSLFHTCQRLCLSTWPLLNFSATWEIWWWCPSNSPACNYAWAKGRGEEVVVRHTMVGQLCSALVRYLLRRCTSASPDSFPNPRWPAAEGRRRIACPAGGSTGGFCERDRCVIVA